MNLAEFARELNENGKSSACASELVMESTPKGIATASEKAIRNLLASLSEHFPSSPATYDLVLLINGPLSDGRGKPYVFAHIQARRRDAEIANQTHKEAP